jgi:hypothetical protein
MNCIVLRVVQIDDNIMLYRNTSVDFDEVSFLLHAIILRGQDLGEACNCKRMALLKRKNHIYLIFIDCSKFLNPGEIYHQC